MISFVANRSTVEASNSAVNMVAFAKVVFCAVTGAFPEMLKAQLATMIIATWLAGMINKPLKHA